MTLYYNEDTLDILNYIDTENGGFRVTHAPASNIATIEYPLNDTYINLERDEDDVVFVSKPDIVSNTWMYYDTDAIKILNVYDCGIVDHANAHPGGDVGHMQLPLGTKIDYLDIRTDENGNVVTFTNKNREMYHWSVDNWEIIRQKRNTLLAVCDWTHTTDVQLTDEQKHKWAVYRKSLRDVTINFQHPSDVIWPTPPQ